jgi:hypothetical protein
MRRFDIHFHIEFRNFKSGPIPIGLLHTPVINTRGSTRPPHDDDVHIDDYDIVGRPLFDLEFVKNLTFKASCFSEMFQPGDLGPMEIHSILNVEGSGQTPTVGSTQPTISDGRNGRTSILLPLTTPEAPNGPTHDGHPNQAPLASLNNSGNQAPLASLDNSGSRATQSDPQAPGTGQPGLPQLGNDLMAQVFNSEPSSSECNNRPELQQSADHQQALSRGNFHANFNRMRQSRHFSHRIQEF